MTDDFGQNRQNAARQAASPGIWPRFALGYSFKKNKNTMEHTDISTMRYLWAPILDHDFGIGFAGGAAISFQARFPRDKGWRWRDATPQSAAGSLAMVSAARDYYYRLPR